MSIRNKAVVVGIGETPTDRLGSKPGEPRKSSAEYLSWAMHLALEDAGLGLKDFQGQGLGATIPTAYPQPSGPKKSLRSLASLPAFSSAALRAARAPYRFWAPWPRLSILV
jgi:hypothetical protein